MRLLVTGGREYADAICVHELLLMALRKCEARGEPLVIVHGAARGLDTLAAEFGRAYGCIVEAHPAEWERYGKRAGMLRNKAMVDTGVDACLSFPGGRGTADCTQRAVNAGIPVGAPVRGDDGQWFIRWWRNK